MQEFNFSSIKCPLKGLVKAQFRNILLPAIQNAAAIVHQFASSCCEFFKLYILHEFDTNIVGFDSIANQIDAQMFERIMQTFNSAARPWVQHQTPITVKIHNFYNDVYSQIVARQLDGTNLSYILHVLADDINTAFWTSVKTNFIKTINKLVNLAIIKPACNLIDRQRNVSEALKKAGNCKFVACNDDPVIFSII